MQHSLLVADPHRLERFDLGVVVGDGRDQLLGIPDDVTSSCITLIALEAFGSGNVLIVFDVE